MKPSAIARLAAFAAVLAIAAPAAATHGGIHPTVRTERVYFHCNGPTKVGNVNIVTNGAAIWDTSEPPGSYTAGNGCGNLDPGAVRGANQNTFYDAQWTGTFTGNLSSLTVEAHNLLLSRVDTSPAAFSVRVWLTIDGEEVVPFTTEVVVTPETSSTGLSQKFVFSVPNLGCSREVFDAEGNLVDVVTDGYVTEDGDGTTEHTLALTLDSTHSDRASAWVYDATEIPSGITFNPEALSGPQAPPVDPANCG